jgi:hypothetical protein
MSASVVTSKFTTEYAARLAAIRAMAAKEPEEYEALVAAVGIEKPKGAAAKSWKINSAEVTEQVAQAEFRAADQSIYLPGYSPEEIAAKQPSMGIGRYTGTSDIPVYSTEQYLKSGIRVGKNGDKIRTGINGEVVNS